MAAKTGIHFWLSRSRLLHDGETRRHSFRINRTTYLVDYLIEPDQVVVVRVWHGRQDRPG